MMRINFISYFCFKNRKVNFLVLISIQNLFLKQIYILEIEKEIILSNGFLFHKQIGVEKIVSETEILVCHTPLKMQAKLGIDLTSVTL